MTTNPTILGMLGNTLSNAVRAAQAATNDTTVMARIEISQVIVSRGGIDLQGGMTEVEAVAYMEALT